MSGGYRFEDNDDFGIFNEPPADEEGLGGDPKNVTGAAGDPDAAEDILMQSWVPGIQMSMTPDGLVEINNTDGEKSVLDPPPPVDAKNLICLANCKHYTANSQLVPSGPDPDAEEHIEMGRWCGAIRTWAEQMDLTEFECFGCTHFEPGMHGDPQVVASAIRRNAKALEDVLRQCVSEKVPLGICVVGPCEHYVAQVGKSASSDEEKVFYRHCQRLSGLGRFYDLRERIITACTGWKPVANSPYIGGAAVENIQRMAKYNKQMAERDQED
jgi:hypothetical protein